MTMTLEQLLFQVREALYDAKRYGAGDWSYLTDAIAARLAQPAQSVDVDFTISDAEPRILTWHGSRGCRPATSAEVSLWDKLAAALQEKGNG